MREVSKYNVYDYKSNKIIENILFMFAYGRKCNDEKYIALH